MSRERDESRRVPGWAPRVAGNLLQEVDPLPRVLLDGVTKVYRDPMTLRPAVAVEGLSLELRPAEIFGLLGPNGAGKTSTIKMILGLTRPTRGTIRLQGRDPRDPRSRARLGYLPENPSFYDHLVADEVLGLMADLFGIDPQLGRRRAEELLRRLGLAGHTKKALRKFSKGMTQRLGLCQALLNEPKVLILDEPMSGLDPIGRAEVKRILREERARGTTVLMSSHVLAEIETLCDRVAIMDRGRVLRMGAVESLLQSEALEWEIVTDAISPTRAALLGSRGHRVEGGGTRWLIRVSDAAAVQEVLRDLTQEGVTIRAVEPRRESLEEFFMRALASDGGPG